MQGGSVCQNCNLIPGAVGRVSVAQESVHDNEVPTVFAICQDEEDAFAGSAESKVARAKSVMGKMAKIFHAKSPLNMVQAACDEFGAHLPAARH